MVSALASGARGLRFNPRSGKGQVPSPNMLFLVLFAGKLLNKCDIFCIRRLTGCPMCLESPSVQVKEPYGNVDMVTCRLSSCNLSVQSTHLLILR